jgi:hypothetical protein
VDDPFIEERTNPHCTIVTLMMWIIMIKAQSTHELVLGYTRTNRSNRSNRSRHPDNEEDFALNRMCSYYSVKWAAQGLMKPLEDAVSYIPIQGVKIYDCTIANRMRGPPGRLVLPFDSTGRHE